LDDASYRQACLQGLAQVKTELGEGGGSKNMAELAMEMLEPAS
jgi:lipid-A-disaccharide synthase